MKAVSGCLIKNTEKAMLDTGYKTLVLAGGVSANSVLRADVIELCKKHGWKLYLPELSLCGDNAVMVGSQGYYEYLSGNIASLELNAFAGKSIEE
jgi:N6-L-threonylcarbamoyladenine synthase